MQNEDTGSCESHRFESEQSIANIAKSLKKIFPDIIGDDNSVIDKFTKFNEELNKAIATQRQPLSQVTIKLIRDLLNDAKDDAQAARILRRAGIISRSVYHLQQSVEKATKAYALAFRAIRPSELRKIGHKSPLTFIRILRKRLPTSFIQFLSSIDSSNEEKIDAAERAIKEEQANLAELSEERINQLIELNNMSRTVLTEKIPKVLDKIPLLFGNVLPREQLEEELISFRTNFDVNIVCHFGSLYLLSAITYPHFAYTRYSDLPFKPSNYKAGLGIVDCEYKLLDQIEDAIDALLNKINETKT